MSDCFWGCSRLLLASVLLIIALLEADGDLSYLLTKLPLPIPDKLTFKTDPLLLVLRGLLIIASGSFKIVTDCLVLLRGLIASGCSFKVLITTDFLNVVVVLLKISILIGLIATGSLKVCIMVDFLKAVIVILFKISELREGVGCCLSELVVTPFPILL